MGTWDRLPEGHPDRPNQCAFCHVVWVSEKIARDCEAHHSRTISERKGE